MTIFEELRADHDRQRELLATLVETTGDEPTRRSTYAELKQALEAHASAEETHFYTVLMTSDLTQEKARHSVSEHKEIDDYLEKLDEYEWSAPAWLETARKLDERVRHHLEEEEREVFPLAGKVFSDDDTETAAVGYRDEMNDHLAST